jgi:L-2-hydroxyglutarate oxidase
MAGHVPEPPVLKTTPDFDVAVVGGGIVGMATASALLSAADRRRPSLVVLEAEDRLAAHQSGRNSGVIHSGLPYAPGSLKARLATAGRERMYRFCAEEEVPHRRCGKLVVAVEEAELPRLDELERRGRANGLTELTRLGAEALREREPHAAGLAALHVGETGVVDFAEVVRALGRRVRAADGEVRTGSRVLAVRRETGNGGAPPRWVLETRAGAVRATWLVNCAGLQSDRVARLAGHRPEVRIVPFRGDYYELVAQRRDLVRGPLYPVADPELPFLGVHFTPTVDGSVEVGPNARPVASRHGYRGEHAELGEVLRDAAATLGWPGSWRLWRRYWRLGVEEVVRSASRAAFARAAARLVPELRAADLVRGTSGIRAQALDRDGRLVDDFRFVFGDREVHVLNAPSPAATASLAIGDEIARRVELD